jgi:MHS family metabolite:H+ symporter-like MFS transporter
VTLRIIQGLGAGAEISGAGTMLAEYAPKGKRGIISSLVAMGTNCGTLSATAIWAVMFFALDREELLAWGWRVPFLASVVVMIFAIWLRMNLKESPVFEKVNDAANCAAGHLTGFDVEKQILLAGDRSAFGQAGNSGLIQTFLAGYLVQTLLFDKAIPTDALMISSILGLSPFRCWAGCPIKWGVVCRTLSLISPPLFWRTRCCRSSSIRAMRRGSCSHHRYP